MAASRRRSRPWPETYVSRCGDRSRGRNRDVTPYSILSPHNYWTPEDYPMKSSLLILLAVATLSVAACNRSNTLPDDSAGAGAVDDGASTRSQNDGGGVTVSPLEEQRARELARLMQQLVVYFDYDTAD